MTQLGPTNATLRPSLEHVRRTGQAPSASLFPSIARVGPAYKVLVSLRIFRENLWFLGDGRLMRVSIRNHKNKLEVIQTNIAYINEAFFRIIDVSKVRSLGKNFGIFSGESPQSFGGEHHTAIW